MTQHSQVQLTQQQLEAEMKAALEGDIAKTSHPFKKQKKPRERDSHQRGQGPKSFNGDLLA